MRRIVLVLLVVAGCAGTQTTPPPMTETTMSADQDVVKLKTGEVVRGKIVQVDASGVAIETKQHVRIFATKDIAEMALAKKDVKLEEPVKSKTSTPPSSWYPSINPKEPMNQTEILWFDPHAPKDCLGELARTFEEIPELDLFVEAGGKIVVHDPRKWGFHAHFGDAVFKPVEKPGLVIDVPKRDVPRTLGIVSPAQEMKSTGESARTSYAIPDVLWARVRDVAAVEAALGAQPFASQKESKLGKIWAFAMPKNASQFIVYLVDVERKHDQVLEQSYAAYGEFLLAPDLIVDLVGADGKTYARVMVLPVPSTLSADGPAPEAVAVLAGEGGAEVVRVAMPPREAVLLPPKAPSTKVTVQVSFYELSKGIREKTVLAWGTGRPTKDVVVTSRELSAETADQSVKIDLSGWAEDRFPAVAWFYHRRTYVWREGGYRAPGEVRVVPARGAGKPTKVISNRDRLPHVLPILFVGPNPEKPMRETLLDEAVAGGMSSALLKDALDRGMRSAFSNMLSNVVPEVTGGGGKGTGGGTVSSVTNVYIVIPPHTATGVPDGGMGLPGIGGPASSLYWDPRNYGSGSSVSPFLGSGSPWGQGRLGNYGVTDPSGRYGDRSGQAQYDPRTGTMTSTDATFGSVDPFAYVFGGWRGAWYHSVSSRRQRRP